MTSSFGLAALRPDLDALADETADSGGLAGDIVQLTTRVVGGMGFGVPKFGELGDDDDEDPDEWVAVDNGGEYIVVGPEFMLTADAAGTSATIVHGSMSWSLHRNGADGSWRVTAFDGSDVAVDVTLEDGNEIDHRDTDAINDELEQQMQEIVDQAVDHEAQIFDAAESGQSTTASTAGSIDASSDAGSTPSPSATTGTDGGGPDVASVVAGTAATMAAGAVVSRARKALGGRTTSLPPPPPPPPALPPPPAWRCTHVVPGQGMSAWSIPDGRVAPAATLPGGVQLELARVQGPWAEVVASNGWRGWVDMSKLLPAPPS